MTEDTPGVKVVVTKDGPYEVTGRVPLAEQVIVTDVEGGSEAWQEARAYAVDETYCLCRCGKSQTKPFCDGSHERVRFDGTETASREPYAAQAAVQDGPASLSLMDAESLCAFARFCDPNGQVWSQIDETDQPAVRENFVRQVGNCPAGRLVAWDRERGIAIEPDLPLSIGLVEDPARECSGPIWLSGGIQLVGADGFEYEIRNRMTLCRCGASANKPFCDGTHAAMKFRAR